MVYVERAPGEDLRPFIRSVWYCRAAGMGHARERVLPNGCMQIVVNLAAETLTDCGADGLGVDRSAGVLVTGARTRYEVVATEDLEEIAGAVVEPGGWTRMFRVRADLLGGTAVGLDDVCGGVGGVLAERMRAAGSAEGVLAAMEGVLRERMRDGRERSWVVDAAIAELGRGGSGVRACARRLGVSERRLLTVFREEVDVGPKAWMRIGRFQAATRALHRGVDVRWAELAVACGFYDQAHFANEFRAFSGMDPTTYCRRRGVWQNHVAIDGMPGSEISKS